MFLPEIMTEANSLTPNGFTDAQRIGWLNELNRRFFEVVKIPLVYVFDVGGGEDIIDLPTGIVSHNIDRLTIGTSTYSSLQYENVPAGQNGWSMDDTTGVLSLFPDAPYETSGMVRYHKTHSTTFVIANPETQQPDAPVQYHLSFVYGLAEMMANALDDTIRAANYGAKYNAELAIAQANYQRGG